MAEKTKQNRVAIRLNDTQLELVEGDITELDVDAIVNPANEDLELGGEWRVRSSRRVDLRSRRSATGSAELPWALP